LPVRRGDFGEDSTDIIAAPEWGAGQNADQAGGRLEYGAITEDSFSGTSANQTRTAPTNSHINFNNIANVATQRKKHELAVVAAARSEKHNVSL